MGANASWADPETVIPSATQVASGVTTSTGSSATSWTVGQVAASGDTGFKNSGPAVIAKFDLSTILSGKTLVSADLKFSMANTGYNSSINIFEIGTDWDASTAVWSDISSSRISTVTSASVWTTKNTTTSHSFDVKDLVDGDADNVVAFLIAVNTARQQTLSNLSMEVVATDASSVTSYSIVKYDLSGNVLSSQSAISGIVGNTVTVADADKANFYSADTNKKYVFDSTDERNVTSVELTATEATNVLKLYFDTYAKYTASVQPVCGDNTVDAITSSWYADETPATIYWPKVVHCSDGYYVVDATASEPNYGYTFSTSELTKSVTYTLDESIIYYAEYENRCGRAYSGLYFIPQSSKGSSRGLTGNNTMTTDMGLTKAGLYNVTIAGGNRDSGHTTTLNLKLKASDGTLSADILTENFKGSEWKGEMTANNVFIPTGSELYVANDNGDGNAKFVGDYIIVRKVEEFSEIVGATDYMTNYSSAWNTTPVWINAGETGYYKFVNFNNTSSTNLFENWYLFGATEASENIVIFGPNHSNTAAKSVYNSKPTFTMADLNNATIELYTTLTAAADGTYTLVTTAITTKADGTKLTPNLVYTQTGLAVSKLKLYISPEKNYLGLLESAENVAIPVDFAVTGTIASSGYSSLASAYGLDFANATGLTAAYVVTKTTTDAVTLTSVDELPANQGVILKGENGAAYSIPVKADATYAGTNLLSAAVTATAIEANTAYILQNGQFHLVNAASTVPAGKAYLLKANVPSAARALGFVFEDDETTGIKAMSRDLQNGEFYNMQGQRVDAPKKGLYIVNGTKVIIK